MYIKTNKFTTSILGLFMAFSLMVSCKQQSEPKTEAADPQVAETVVKTDPLPSWNDGKAKEAIINYVEDVTNKDGANFIPVMDRIATFDNDGTLWSEKPIYFQFFFALDRIKAMAPDHPEWKDKQPFKAVLENDMPTLMKQGERGLLEIVMMTHAGTTTDEFEKYVNDWIATAEHPTKKKHFNELVFLPMLELLDYLRANDFKTFIVSGGGIEFMRPWGEKTYGIPKNQIIGSSIQTKYEYNDGKPFIERLAKLDLNDDKEGKPVGINRYIGRRPVFAAGNSDGDLQMLRWTDSNKFKTFKLYVHHTDSIREWAYDRKSPVGTFDKALDEATEKGWTITSMKDDWKVIYPFEK